GEGSKKAQGQARKAEAVAQKSAGKARQAEEAEARDWDKGSKSNAKAEAAAAKAAEAARKKAEKDALLKEEEASLPSKPKGAGAKKAEKKFDKKPARGIDSALGGLDAPSALNASGIDNALDALDLTNNNDDKIDRHPERRFKAAYAQFEERRLEEMKDEKGLRRNQKIDQIRKEFEKHPDNPFNQVSGAYDMTKEDIAALKESEKQKKEKRLGG
ncbi:DUF1014-domain-containing protein, partial [Pleomassaria siparia CBS 279.74]